MSQNSELESVTASLAVDHGLLSPKEAVALIGQARSTGRPLSTLLKARISERQLIEVAARELGLRFYDMSVESDLKFDDKLIGNANISYLAERAIMPLVTDDNQVVIAAANPSDVDAINYLKARLSDRQVRSMVVAPRSQIQSRLVSLTSAFDPTTLADQGMLIPAWLDFLLTKAAADGASDLHFRSKMNGQLLVRMRVDGILRPIGVPSAILGRESEVIASLITRCESLDPTNLREAQSGTFSFQSAGRNLDARLENIPVITGSNLTLRILDPENIRKRLEDMGYSERNLARMRAAVAASQGLAIVVGPTGSGKSTTLLSLLGEVDPLERNIITIEDPPEYKLEHVAQIQLRHDLGERSLTTSKAIRSVLRQDPDVIMVGEVRDPDTGKAALDAAQTGHLVLTTLHTNSAPATYVRLVQMGLPAYLVAETVSLIVSQRLVRRVHSCATTRPINDEDKELLGKWADGILEVPEPVGCLACAGQGYMGRIAAAEVLVPSPTVRSLVVSNSATAEIAAAAEAEGLWQPLVADIARLIKAGVTTPSEVLRVAAIDATVEEGE